MAGETEDIRRALVAEINQNASHRELLEHKEGKVWSTDELKAEFEVIGFMAPFVVVKRRSDGRKGSMCFQHDPRFYFGFTED